MNLPDTVDVSPPRSVVLCNIVRVFSCFLLEFSMVPATCQTLAAQPCNLLLSLGHAVKARGASR